MICVLNATCQTSITFDIDFIVYYYQMELEYFARTEEKLRRLYHVVYFLVPEFRKRSKTKKHPRHKPIIDQ